VPRRSAFDLNNATLPFVLALADKGWREALRSEAHLRAGLNISAGKFKYAPVGNAQGLPIMAVEKVLGL
jgi:alanine dehydrogenase